MILICMNLLAEHEHERHGEPEVDKRDAKGKRKCDRILE